MEHFESYLSPWLWNLLLYWTV